MKPVETVEGSTFFTCDAEGEQQALAEHPTLEFIHPWESCTRGRVAPVGELHPWESCTRGRVAPVGELAP